MSEIKNLFLWKIDSLILFLLIFENGDIELSFFLF